MSKPPSSLPPSLQIGLLFLAAMPCLPGLIFLLMGILTDPHRQPHDFSASGQVRFEQAWTRTRGLLLVGGVVLMIGTLGSAAVVWKITRIGLAEPRQPEEAAEEAPP